MTPNEIRQEWAFDTNNVPPSAPGIQLDILRELTAQIAESNERSKPRWVNLGTMESPCVINANLVTGISSGQQGGRNCVYVRLRGISDPYVCFDHDHDEVQGLLRIGEDWISQPSVPTVGRYMSHADYDEAMAIIDTARRIANDPEMLKVPTGPARTNLDHLTQLFESYDSLPF